MYTNYKATQNHQENRLNQINHSHQNQNQTNSYNNQHYFKNIYNKRNYQTNVTYKTLEKNIVKNKHIENYLPNNFHASERDSNYKNDNDYEKRNNQSFGITLKNTQIKEQSEEFICDSDLNYKLNFSIKHEEKQIENFSVNNSLQVDSYNSLEEKNNLKNADQSILTEKNYIEDNNTKTNTNSNTPVSASPVIACHKKSINSIKNEFKLDDSRDNNTNNNKKKTNNENSDGKLYNDEKKEELICKVNYIDNFGTNESNNSKLIQQKSIKNFTIFFHNLKKQQYKYSSI